jgi:hypothetical protein
MLEFSAPGEPGYDTATRVFNLTAPARPDLAVTVRSVAEVRAAVGRAAASGLPVRVQSTGHASAAVRPIDGGLLIQTRLDGEVTVDPERRVAVIPAGTSWGAVVPAAAAHGLAAPHGSSELVGAVGYLLRGGLSFYGRKTGLAVNSVRAIELVTADGAHRRVDAVTDPELFWALRGGGGGFGVVTSIEVELFSAASVISGGSYWRAAHAEELMSIWRAWSLTAPDEATTSVRVMNLPPAHDVPPVLAEGPVFCVDGVFLGSVGEQQYPELLDALRAVADPVLDHWAPGSTADVLEAHMDPGEPMPFVGDHFLLSEIGSDGVLAYLDAVGGRSPLVAAGLRQLGGAFARPVSDGGVLDHFDAAYAYLGAGIPDGPSAEAAIRECNAKVRAALAPWDTGSTAPSLIEAFSQPQGHLSASQVAAVDVVRAAVDPDGLFRGDVMPGATALWASS